MKKGLVSTSVNVSDSRVTYVFPENYRTVPYADTLLVELAQTVPTGTTATLPVYFGNTPLMGYNNEPVTVANLAGAGIYMVYYNNIGNAKRLQIMTGYVPTATAAATTTPTT